MPRSEREWQRYYALRWRLLRAPWHQPRGSERDDAETDAHHIMACLPDGTPVAVGRVHLNTPQQAQIRFMAVKRDYQHGGVGRRILEALEHQARVLGAQELVLDARRGTQGFYERHGYEVIGSGHTLFGRIEHVRMHKSLTSG